MEWLPAEGVRSLDRYLVRGEEHLVFVMRRHWVVLAEPIATAVGSTILLVWLLSRSPGAGGATLLVVLWLIVLGRSGYHIIEWRDSWFGSTQRRLMLSYGLVTRKVAMMPLEKVTDMSYAKSPTGQLLGYGEFVLESAGQDQALRSVGFIPHADETYRLLLGTMFGPKGAKPEPEPEDTATIEVEADVDQASEPAEFSWDASIQEFLTDAEPTLPLPRTQDDG